MKFVNSSLKLPENCYFAWTDSSIVLSWLSSHPRRWKSFVANRTSQILSTIPRSQWRHVQSSCNAADLASRGTTAKQLVNSRLSWEGPPWSKSNWRDRIRSVAYDQGANGEIRERYTEVFHANVSENLHSNLFHYHSSLSKILRILGKCFQFTQNCKESKLSKELGQNMKTTWIKTEDINKALKSCIISTQEKSFQHELSQLRTKQEISSSSRIISLTPFLDAHGVLRVGGRLENSISTYSVKHPIILPKDHIFVTYLIKHLHEKYLHAGVSLLLNIIRQRYWILSCRSLIKTHISKCIVCVKHRAETSQQLMADLPEERVGAYRIFENTGVEYAGPLQLLIRRGRGARTVKGYIVLFICFSTRAIHIELAGDLTSDTFISCLKRFIARHGVPTNIYSDNGTNFVGAAKHISWHFNPPVAPRFGGLWEAGVKAVKAILKRVIGDTYFTYEEMYTLLVQIEGLLNSRPLRAENDDISNLDALTPSHFLIGQALTTLPEPHSHCHNISLQHRWRILQRAHQNFWTRWSSEYLSSLQRRPKWQKVKPNLSIGDLVVIKEPNMPPAKWILGRIIETHPGRDQLFRTATAHTTHGDFKRPITRLCKLPVDG